MFLSIAHIGQSQATDPCDCKPGDLTVIGTTGQSTNLGTGTIPDCAFVRGQLIVNGNTVWSNLRIRMETGSEIFVTGSLEISGCYLSTCDDLWKGIRTNGYLTNLFVSNSYIQGAEFGMYLQSFTTFSCQNNWFVNDYIGIASSSPFEADQSEVILYQRGLISGNNFYTSTNLPDPYPGQFYDPSWPTTPSEIPYNQGYAAVYIAGTTGLNFGFASAEGSSRNKVYNMRNGIIARNYSDIEIAGSDFYDFEGTVSLIQGLDPRRDINQVGINLDRSFAHIEKNTFENILRGVRTLEASQKILENEFEITKIPLYTYSRGIEANTPFGISILSNTIKYGWIGIELTGSGMPFEIHDNLLTRNIPARNSVGISVSHCRLPLRSGEVTENVITTEVGHVGTIGMGFTDCVGLYVKENIIDFPISLNAGVNNAGISGMGLRNCTISYNDITGAAAYESYSGNSGVIMTNSNNNFLFCNEMDQMYRGKWMVAMNDNTRIEANTFEEASIAFEIFGPAALGTHNHSGNLWCGDYTGQFGGFISGLNPAITAFNSHFFIDISDATLCPLVPSPIGPAAVLGTVWFEDQDGVGKTCIAIDDPDDPIADTLANILLTELEFEVYNDELTWMRKAAIFEAILEDPSLLSNTVLDSFYDAEKNTALGKLVWCERQLTIRHGGNLASKQEAIDSIGFYLEEIVYLDSLIDLNPVNLNALMALRALKCDTLQVWTLDLFDQVDTETSITIDSVEAAVDTIQLLTATNDLESDLKDILILSEPKWKGDTLTTTNVGGLTYFATQCPWLGGRSLVWGQKLYAIELDSLLSAVPFDCPEIQNIGTEEYLAKDSKLGDAALTAWPNPVEDVLFVQAPGVNGVLELFDVRGVKRFTQLFAGKQAIVDVSELAPGIYILQLRDGTIIHNMKISIQ